MSNPYDPPSTAGTPRLAPIPASAVRIDVAGLSDRGKVRENNEDAFAIFKLGRFMERITSSLPPGQPVERLEQIGYLLVVASRRWNTDSTTISTPTSSSAPSRTWCGASIDSATTPTSSSPMLVAAQISSSERT